MSKININYTFPDLYKSRLSWGNMQIADSHSSAELYMLNVFQELGDLLTALLSMAGATKFGLQAWEAPCLRL